MQMEVLRDISSWAISAPLGISRLAGCWWILVTSIATSPYPVFFGLLSGTAVECVSPQGNCVFLTPWCDPQSSCLGLAASLGALTLLGAEGVSCHTEVPTSSTISRREQGKPFTREAIDNYTGPTHIQPSRCRTRNHPAGKYRFRCPRVSRYCEGSQG